MMTKEQKKAGKMEKKAAKRAREAGAAGEEVDQEVEVINLGELLM